MPLNICLTVEWSRALPVDANWSIISQRLCGVPRLDLVTTTVRVSISESPYVDNFKAGLGLIREMSPGLIFNHQSSSWQNNGAPFGALNPETHAKRKWETWGWERKQKVSFLTQNQRNIVGHTHAKKERVLKDLWWCICHHRSVEKSAGLINFGSSPGAQFDSRRKRDSSNKDGFEQLDPQPKVQNYCFQ